MITIEWLDLHSGSVVAMATIILVLVTGFYAWRTHGIASETKRQAEASVRMAEEMEKTRELTYRPELTLYHLPREFTQKSYILLVIENVGNGPATNVKVECWWRGGYYVEASGLSLGGKEHRNFRCDHKSGVSPKIPQLREEVRHNDMVVQLSCQNLNDKPVGPSLRRVLEEQIPEH